MTDNGGTDPSTRRGWGIFFVHAGLLPLIGTAGLLLGIVGFALPNEIARVGFGSALESVGSDLARTFMGLMFLSFVFGGLQAATIGAVLGIFFPNGFSYAISAVVAVLVNIVAGIVLIIGDVPLHVIPMMLAAAVAANLLLRFFLRGFLAPR